MIDAKVLLDKAQIQSGMHVADLGCGRVGHVVSPAAALVGDRGIVYAVDIIKDSLEQLKRRAQMEGLSEVQTVWSDLEKLGATPIPARSLDAAFVVNVLNQSDNRHGILQEAHRLLKDKARLVIVDWSQAGLAIAPPEDRQVDFEDIKRWAEMHGFVVQEEFDLGKYHHGLVLFKHD